MLRVLPTKKASRNLLHFKQRNYNTLSRLHINKARHAANEEKSSKIAYDKKARVKQAMILRLLKQVLPNEQTSGSHLTFINKLLNNPNKINVLTAQQITLLRNLLSSLPTEKNLLSTNGLTEAIQQSGLFLERHLLTNEKQWLTKDIKAQWLKILHTLRENPLKQKSRHLYWLSNDATLPNLNFSKLLQNKFQAPINGALPYPIHTAALNLTSDQNIESFLKNCFCQLLARLTAQQLNSVSNNLNETYSLMLDLPIKMGQEIQSIPLLIEKNIERSAKNSQLIPIESIMLALELKKLGAIQIKVSIIKNNIAIQIWSNNPQTNCLFIEKDETLQSLLSNRDKKILTFYHQGLNLERNQKIKPLISLLDVKT